MIRALLNIVDSPKPTADFRRCLRAHDTGSGNNRCRACASICPKGAVTFGKGVNVDQDMCNSCGLCLSECPASAISHSQQHNSALLPVHGIPTISLGCKLGSTNGATWACPVESVCGLSWRFVAATALASSQGRVRLDCRYCNECSHGKGVERAERSAQNATDFLEAIGFRPDIQIVQDDSSAEDSGVSRRDFFRAASGRLQAYASRATQPYFDLPQSVTPIRTILWIAAQQAARRSPTSAFLTDCKSSPWGSFRVTDACNGCNKCTHACPWGAWRSTTQNGVRTLSFSMKDCRDCGACENACPQNAIVRHVSGVPRPVDKPTEMISVQVTRCVRCGREHTGRPKSLCSNCAKQASLIA